MSGRVPEFDVISHPPLPLLFASTSVPITSRRGSGASGSMSSSSSANTSWGPIPVPVMTSTTHTMAQSRDGPHPVGRCARDFLAVGSGSDLGAEGGQGMLIFDLGPCLRFALGEGARSSMGLVSTAPWRKTVGLGGCAVW